MSENRERDGITRNEYTADDHCYQGARCDGGMLMLLQEHVFYVNHDNYDTQWCQIRA